MTVEDIARVCHEVNRAYCRSIGDDSQVSWEDAPEWQKKSAMLGVNLHMEHPETTPEESHKSWLAQKQADGWTWGPVKLVEFRQHPCIMPYEELPRDQRVKDHLFRAVVKILTQDEP